MTFREYMDGIFPATYRGTAFISDVRLVLTQLEKDGYIGINPPEVSAIPSELERVDIGSEYAWKLISDSRPDIGQDPSNKLTPGVASVDLSITVGTKGETSGASGKGAFASGINTQAIGEASSVFGKSNQASGFNAFSANYSNEASGSNSFAIGNGTVSSGAGSFSSGESTTSSGRSSSSFGVYSTASGIASFSTGYNTGASGDYSTAFGHYSTSNGASSVAAGNYATANGYSSFAFGDNVTSTGSASHAEGVYTNANGDNSHAEGNSTNAMGLNSHAEGNGTIAQNDSMHAAGKFNIGTSTDTIHETGIGTGSKSKKNAFEIYTDGRVHTPELTQALILDPRSVTTKEYVDSSIVGISHPVAVDPGDSAAVDIAGLVSDYNTLLANLRAAGIIA